MKDQLNELMNADRLEEAKAICARICEETPEDAEAWQTLSTIHGKLGNAVEAETFSRRAIAIRPDYAEAFNNLGKALLIQGKLDGALTGFYKVIELDPNFSEAYCKVANILAIQLRYEEALTFYKKALQSDSENIEAHHGLGNVLFTLNYLEDALICYQEALRLSPDCLETLNNMGNCLNGLGRLDEALDYYEQVLKLNSNVIHAVVGKATIFNKLGKYVASYDSLKPYIDAGVDNPSLAIAYANVCSHFDRCDDAISYGERTLNELTSKTQPSVKMSLHFRLGHLYDASSNYAKAYAHYRQANESSIVAQFDPIEHVEFIDRLINTFSEEWIRNCPRSTIRSNRPIFIIGMPRSGTSLVEQILCSHPAIYGGGELDTFVKAPQRLSAMLLTSKSYPESVSEMTAEICDRYSRDYLNRLMALSKDSLRVTNKMPANFLHLGIISMLFPDAYVIHCVRDPLDTCLSCYFLDLPEVSYAFSYNLEHLGVYYKQYKRLMNHWNSVLPLRIMEVQYEELVSNKEEVSRAMIQYCDLDWDDHCLRFNENKRLVHTASIQQVRKPIYRSSIGRWKHYDRYLSRLKKKLYEERAADYQ